MRRRLNTLYPSSVIESDRERESFGSGAVGKILAETRIAIWQRYDGSWRKLSDILGIPHSILHAAAHEEWEHVGWQTLRKIRRSLGLPDPGELVAATKRPPPPIRPAAEPELAIVQVWRCPYCGMTSRDRRVVRRHAQRYCRKWQAPE
ncbi:MAG: hypothetical protein V1755_13770 [Chloroflexota bacterium]